MKFDVIGEDLGFTEGPVICQDGSYLVVSIERGLIMELTPDGPRVRGVPGGGPNGLTEGGGGRIYITQNGGNRPARRVPGITGGIQVLDPQVPDVEWLSRDPISPNDLCFGPDGYLYATDPTRRPQRDDGRLWRFDVTTGESELLCSVGWYPNGIGFGLDDALYVASTGDASIKRFELTGGTLSEPEIVVRMERGHPDGFTFDMDGNIIIAAVSHTDEYGSVQVFDTNGRLLDLIEPGTDLKYTNVALTGTDLIVCESGAGRVLMARDWPSVGLPLYPFRKGNAA